MTREQSIAVGFISYTGLAQRIFNCGKLQNICLTQIICWTFWRIVFYCHVYSTDRQQMDGQPTHCLSLFTVKK